MKGLSKILGSIVIIIFLSSCAAIRSGKGLSKGELNVGYTAPLAGSIRYGITDNIESRFSVIFESYNFDLYFHTNSDSSLYNYGMTIGGHYINDNHPSYFTGFTLDRKINNHFLPYISYIIYSDLSKMGGMLSLGSEIIIPLTKNNSITLLVIPELSYTTKPVSVENFKSSFLGLVNIGLTFDIKKLLR